MNYTQLVLEQLLDTTETVHEPTEVELNHVKHKTLKEFKEKTPKYQEKVKGMPPERKKELDQKLEGVVYLEIEHLKKHPESFIADSILTSLFGPMYSIVVAFDAGTKIIEDITK